jgi:hypothetical protein
VSLISLFLCFTTFFFNPLSLTDIFPLWCVPLSVLQKFSGNCGELDAENSVFHINWIQSFYPVSKIVFLKKVWKWIPFLRYCQMISESVSSLKFSLSVLFGITSLHFNSQTIFLI